MHQGPDILLQISAAIVVATGLALLARFLRQPLILAYIAAGIILGPGEGLGWVHAEQIEPISELGLILLLFMIGLEIDLKKIKQSGSALIAVGIGQFAICLIFGLLVLPFMSVAKGSQYGALYLAVAAGLSSTMIVVKLLYDKFELDTIPGRITLGILVFQDIWAILFLAFQHDLKNPQILPIAISITKGAALVIFSLGLSRYVLPRVFRWVAKTPELMLICALGWCFGVATLAAILGLSREMGALIAGISLSAFPYNLDVVAKIISLRDFFITLFFVSLGTKIPRPDIQLVVSALMLSGFLIVSRFLSITPILHAFKLGNRVSFVPAVNLAQMSEFSLVICALGGSAGHIREDLLSVVVLTFVITSVVSTYAIQYNHSIFLFAQPLLRRLGLRDLDHEEVGNAHAAKPIVFLGFSRYASSLFHELLEEDPELQHQIAVIDFNPQVKQELDRRGIHNIYGDISHFDTLQHAHLEESEVLISTIPDAILKGTTNERLLRQLKSIAPNARMITTGEFYYSARDLYREGSAFVFLPRLMSIERLAHAVRSAMVGDPVEMRNEELLEIEKREGAEILP